MYRQACDLKLPQDSELITFLLKNWIKWSESLPQQIDVPRAYRYSIIQENQLTYRYFGTLAKLLFLRLCPPSSNKQREAVRSYLIPIAIFQRKIFQYQNLTWLLQIWLPIFWKIKEQLCTDIKSRVVIDGLNVWKFFSNYKMSDATNNLYSTEWRKSTRNPLYARDMIFHKKTLKIWEEGDVNKDQIDKCGEMARIDWWTNRIARGSWGVCYRRTICWKGSCQRFFQSCNEKRW